MAEKERLVSTAMINKKFVLILRKKIQIDRLNNILDSKSYDNTVILMTLKKSLIIMVKQAIKIALWVMASLAIFMVVMALSVFAFYLNGQKEKDIESDLAVHKLQDDKF